MRYQTDDTRISGMQEVLPPDKLMEELPISESSSKLVFESTNKLGAPQVPVGTLPGAYVV